MYAGGESAKIRVIANYTQNVERVSCNNLIGNNDVALNKLAVERMSNAKFLKLNAFHRHNSIGRISKSNRLSFRNGVKR